MSIDLFDLIRVSQMGGIESVDNLHRVRERLKVFWGFTVGLGSLSTCKRLSVGCLIIPANLSEVLSIGYNGQPHGRPNEGCRASAGSCGCVHSEANALVKLKTDNQNLVLLVTHSPCEHCAGLIANSRRIRAVIYGTEYRDPSCWAILNDSEISASKISDLLKEK